LLFLANLAKNDTLLALLALPDVVALVYASAQPERLELLR